MISSFRFQSFAKTIPMSMSLITVKNTTKSYVRSALQRITQIILLSAFLFSSKISMSLWTKAEKSCSRWMKASFNFWSKSSFSSKKKSCMRHQKLKNSLLAFHITLQFKTISICSKKLKHQPKTGFARTLNPIFHNSNAQ